MKWFKKQYFFVAISILFAFYLADFLTGGIKNMIIRHLVERNNPNEPSTVIENPLSNTDLEGQLLTGHRSLENYDKIPCATSGSEALQILTTYIKRENSTSYFES